MATRKFRIRHVSRRGLWFGRTGLWALADLAARKAELDKETRRKVRAFWIPVGLIVGGLAGFALAALTL